MSRPTRLRTSTNSRSYQNQSTTSPSSSSLSSSLLSSSSSSSSSAGPVTSSGVGSSLWRSGFSATGLRQRRSFSCLYLFPHPLSDSLKTLDLVTVSRGIRDWRTLPGVKPRDVIEERVVERLLELERLQVSFSVDLGRLIPPFQLLYSLSPFIYTVFPFLAGRAFLKWGDGGRAWTPKTLDSRFCDEGIQIPVLINNNNVSK